MTEDLWDEGLDSWVILHKCGMGGRQGKGIMLLNLTSPPLLVH